MAKPTLEKRYVAIGDEDKLWSVIDTYTDVAVVIRGESMVLLTEDNAFGLAEILNRHNFISKPTIH